MRKLLDGFRKISIVESDLRKAAAHGARRAEPRLAIGARVPDGQLLLKFRDNKQMSKEKAREHIVVSKALFLDVYEAWQTSLVSEAYDGMPEVPWTGDGLWVALSEAVKSKKSSASPLDNPYAQEWYACD